MDSVNNSFIKKILYLFILSVISIVSCKKQNYNQSAVKNSILQKIDSFDISSATPISGDVIYSEGVIYDNDSIFYTYYNWAFAKGHLYIKGRRYEVNLNENTNDSIIKLYNLKKMKFNRKNNYKDYFEYEDCILKKEMRMDSGAVHTLQAKNGATYQIIDVSNKPIKLQICFRANAYNFVIKSRQDRTKSKSYGTGRTSARLYDFDKDGQEEILLFFTNDVFRADVYKINLPK